jgi:predicted transcriptional regulator
MAEQKKTPTNLVRKMATDAALRNLLRKTGPGQTRSQSEIADQAGLSRELINRIERGAIEKVTEQIARILERGEDGSA